MTPSFRPLTQALTYAGALPFFLLLPPTLPVLAPVDALHGFLTYGAVIAAFMAGTLWGIVQGRDTAAIGHLIASNVLALAAWGTLLIEPGRGALAIQLAIFVALLASDYRLATAHLEKPWYWRLRTRVTALVCIAYGAKIILV
ncbi:DUF3429 domain-containing protein [Affinirhizobium pseudoryzae]|jgi:hypothetical protein|uniref:DUF3429 domain-containing protein n=1 Tax=Allorhizobium pseudoryzae TaxID=379684 RepID=UPI0013EB1EF5|nr:DUF3429 domain-containing protein [Allorhizobium pseudoryzae]